MLFVCLHSRKLNNSCMYLIDMNCLHHMNEAFFICFCTITIHLLECGSMIHWKKSSLSYLISFFKWIITFYLFIILNVVCTSIFKYNISVMLYMFDIVYNTIKYFNYSGFNFKHFKMQASCYFFSWNCIEKWCHLWKFLYIFSRFSVAIHLFALTKRYCRRVLPYYLG